MATLWLSLGSNLEPRRGYLGQAVASLQRAPFSLLALSNVYESEPQDVTDQPWFLNMAAKVACELEPLPALRALQAIEAAAGKQIERRRGPRTLDIDVLLYDERVIESPELQVPHPALRQRHFVLQPLAEIDPSLVLPPDGQSVREALAKLPRARQVTRRLGPLE